MLLEDLVEDESGERVIIKFNEDKLIEETKFSNGKQNA